jgi:membrane associated rhomboid family serine protease
MLPLGDDNSQRHIVPWVTYALIIVNIVVYFIEITSPDPVRFIYAWGTVPAQIAQGYGLITLFTSMFLHDPSSWLHIGGNMLFLWIFGDNVEDAFGHGLYFLFYLLCGVAASVAQVLVNTSADVPGVGASGAIAGVLGAYILMYGTNRVRVLVGYFLVSVPAFIMIGLWILLQLFSGFGTFTNGPTDNVAYFAHIGGFFVGLVLAFIMRGIARKPDPSAARAARR